MADHAFCAHTIDYRGGGGWISPSKFYKGKGIMNRGKINFRDQTLKELAMHRLMRRVCVRMGWSTEGEDIGIRVCLKDLGIKRR